jgi:hypothetical protein
MKKIISMLVALAIVAVSQLSTAQNSYTFKKVTKDTLIEVKKLEAEGWQALKGDISIGQQLKNTWEKEGKLNDFGLPKFVFSYAIAGTSNFTESKADAIEHAKVRMVKLVKSNIQSVLENNLKKGDLDSTKFTVLKGLIDMSKATPIVNSDKFFTTMIIQREETKNKTIEVKINMGIDNILLYESILEEMKSIYISNYKVKDDKLIYYLDINRYINN